MFSKVSDRDSFGYMNRYRSAGEAGIDHSLIAKDYSLWMNADTVSGNDGDLVITAGHFTQSTSGYRPVLKKAGNGINNHNALLFGSDDWLTSDTNLAVLNTNFTVFCVFNPNFSGDGTLFNQQYSADNILSLYRAGTTYKDWIVDIYAPTSSPNGTAQMMEYRVTDSGNTIRINDTDGSAGSRTTGSGSAPIFLAKAQSTGGLVNFQGLIAEFIFYPKELSSDELTKTRNYLNDKYNLWA